MALEHSAYESPETLVTLDQLQIEAARKAETIGSFQASFQAAVHDALSHDQLVDAEKAESRLSIVNDATSSHGGVRLATTEQGVLAYNTIGAGSDGMRLSRDTFAFLHSADASKDIDQTVAHEAAHGDQVALQGELEMDGQVVDHQLLYEGHAEIRSNKEIGKGESWHRKGQPAEVYGEGQDMVLSIMQQTGRAAFEKALTQNGDLHELQRAMAA